MTHFESSVFILFFGRGEAHINQTPRLSLEAQVELSTDKHGSSGRKELSTSSGPRPASTFTPSPASVQPTSLEQVQATADFLDFEQLQLLFDVFSVIVVIYLFFFVVT